MKTILYAPLLTAFIAGSALAVEPPNPKDLIQGKWDLVLEKSKFCNAAAAPKAGNRWIFDAGWGLIVTEWGGTAADGKPIVTRYVARYDGGKYPANITKPDSAEIDLMEAGRPAPPRVHPLRQGRQGDLDLPAHRVRGRSDHDPGQHLRRARVQGRPGVPAQITLAAARARVAAQQKTFDGKAKG